MTTTLDALRDLALAHHEIIGELERILRSQAHCTTVSLRATMERAGHSAAWLYAEQQDQPETPALPGTITAILSAADLQTAVTVLGGLIEEEHERGLDDLIGPDGVRATTTDEEIARAVAELPHPDFNAADLKDYRDAHRAYEAFAAILKAAGA